MRPTKRWLIAALRSLKSTPYAAPSRPLKADDSAARAPHCDQITLIVSDVPPGEEASVASGPTLAPPVNAPEALEVVARYNLRRQLPESVLARNRASIGW